ncbi:MAG: glycosyltransferase, partial [Porphyromonadaceae bacterium]|nr:glycosyltransferase [Porphyromonadaceae bacterium]
MKIVYVLNNTWYAGGQTRVLINKVNYWARQGHEVYVLTSDQIGLPPYYEMDPRVKTVDYAIGYIGADQLNLLHKAWRLSRFIVRHYFLLKRTLNEIQPDIVVSMYGKEVYF